MQPASKKLTAIEIMRTQMDIPESNEARTLRAMERAASMKVGRETGALLVSMELLLNMKSSDFSDQMEYQLWQLRQQKVLQAVLFPYSGNNVSGTMLASLLRQRLPDFSEGFLEIGVNAETLQILKDTVLGSDSSAWAESFPLNLYLYEMLLRSSFDNLDESSFSEDIDDILGLAKKTWAVLGIDQMLHNSCFIWVLFSQFVLTGEHEFELLEAAEAVMKDVWKLVNAVDNEAHMDVLISVLTSIQAWTDKRLLMYHEHFASGNQDTLKNLMSVALLCAQILQKYLSQNSQRGHSEEYHVRINRIQVYIQSALRYIFSQMSRRLDVDKSSYVDGKAPILALLTLAKDIAELATEEQQNFCPTFKQWHPYPATVAAVTLHTCYRLELKQFLSTAKPSIEVVQVLQSAAKLEKQLVQMATEEEAESDERWKDIFDELYSFASEPEVALVLKKWVGLQIGQLQEWSERILQEEDWSQNATRERYAFSAVELLRIVEDTSDAFFKFSVSQAPALVQDFTSGIDAALDHYVYVIVARCGKKEDFIPHLALTRGKDSSISMISKLNDSLWKKYEALAQYKTRVWPQLQNDLQFEQSDPLSLQRICVRINTLYQVLSEVEFLEKKLRFGWQELPRDKAKVSVPITLVTKVKLERSRASCQAGIERLFDIAAYKVVFGDLRGVFWEGLYLGGVSEARIGTVIQQLNYQLEIIANTLSDCLRNQMVNYLMMACFEGFLQIILYRTKPLDEIDTEMLKEDFMALKELFIANGEGLPEDLVEKASEPVAQFLSSLPLKQDDSTPDFKGTNMDTDFRTMFRSDSRSNSSKAQYSASSNTLSSVLGYKCHVLASKFVMRTYSSSKR
ncbi:hypothetical protein O6H91_Y030100 [Diphasiastrum complanatum]|nr:hypothetical protein O6H91_Y030100 [Diphasiastrum complanatum]